VAGSPTPPYINHTSIGSAIVLLGRIRVPEGAVVKSLKLLYDKNGATGTVVATADAAIEKWTLGGVQTQAVLLSAGTSSLTINGFSLGPKFQTHTDQTMSLTDTNVSEDNTSNAFLWVRLTIPSIGAGFFNVHGIKVSYSISRLRPTT